jgi:1,4-dihydroxy-2-naphthoate octaprenyltransferase
LLAAIAPVLVGTSLAGVSFNPVRALLALIVSLALQIAVNYANDYSDGIKGIDEDRIGPIRLVGQKLATPRAVKNAAYIFFLIAAVAGLTLALQTSLWLILVGAIAILAAWTYTGGPKPYGYSALGEVSVFLFFGVVATAGSYYVQSQEITFASLMLSVPIGALACAILGLNNLRDLEKDKISKKNTLAVILGDRSARIFYVLLLMIAHVASIIATFASPYILFTLVLLPVSGRLSRTVLDGAKGKALIPLLGNTGKLQMGFAFFISIALFASSR